MKLKDKTILITGATGGVGLCLLQQLRQQGNRIICVARSPEKLAAVASRFPDVLTLMCDLSRLEQVRALAKELNERGEEVDVLLNNAAVQYTPQLLDEGFDLAHSEGEIATNFTAVVALTSLLLPTLIKGSSGKAVVNVSTGLAFFPKVDSAVYCATKAALHSFSQSLRYQVEVYGLRVHEVFMPLVDTPMTEGRGNGKISADGAADALIQGVENGYDEIYVGKVRLLRLIMAFWPGLAKRIMRGL